MIIACNCKSKYQDETFGTGKRVHNPVMKEPKGQHWRCSVCKTEHTKGGGEENSKKKGK
jgi:hypothetical protein